MGPLHGLKILEIAGIGPGPFCAMLLADLGAEVIRIERAEGPAGSRQDVSLRNRRSLALDLKKPEAIQAVLRMAETSDALIEGFRPGVMERLGLGPEAVRARNPRLVYGRMTGWGQEGPMAKLAGHDINYIALTGALHAMGRAGEPPAPPLNLVGDYGGGGMLLAMGLLAALLERERSGQGQVVDAAMVDGAALLMAPIFGMKARGRWGDERAANLLDGAASFYDSYACACGGFVAVGPIEPAFFDEMVAKMGLDPSLFEGRMEPARWPAHKALLAAAFMTKTRDEWAAIFAESDACVAPILSMEEAPQHPHNAARGSFVDHHGAMQPAPAPRFSRTPGGLTAPPPLRGEHSREVLAEFGFSEAEINALAPARATR
ncbi:CaiB/BaiF CoA transferase family protein [Sediminicoccus rosea]|jgi:alpha-methylacyl-CoA racemase|uniref:CaiB/BaiF CoA-transferase family protein n=1 Tax=Sediminicoccus rosea TaxID=1225128 RepID=A0ABZ0PP56_9PROT|nr:CaiB/BaiF CoA-transferase family protein [Sediminicoccus rosea]WPB87514.1 CaiB/BaiF CoA-transferase family protein [Sediminicoccus rosea]